MARVGLDRERIVTTALDLVDDIGLDKLSTRALAERLGVQSPALYWHFRNKSEMVAAMAEAMSLEQPTLENGHEALGRRPSRAAVAALLIERAQGFRRVLLSHRDGARIHAGSRPPTSRLRVVEAQLDALGRIGFDPVAAALVTLAVSRFVVGWVLEEQADQAQDVPAPDVADYPRVSAALAVLVREDPDADFTTCVTAVVDGLVRNR